MEQEAEYEVDLLDDLREENLFPSCICIDLHMIGLSETDTLLKELTLLRWKDEIPDLLIFLTHHPCLALGARGLNPDDIVKPLEWFEQRGISLIGTVRGGGITYLWEGQILCYPVLKLLPSEQDLTAYMFRLEEVALQTLKDVGVTAHRKRGKAAQIGLWWEDQKVASMGIHSARWVTSYGFALNIAGDTSPSRFIHPCGLKGVRLVTVSEITGAEPPRSTVISSIVDHFSEVFNRKIIPPFSMLRNEVL